MLGKQEYCTDRTSNVTQSEVMRARTTVMAEIASSLCMPYDLMRSAWKSLPTLDTAHRMTAISLGVSSELCPVHSLCLCLFNQVSANVKFWTHTRIERRIRNRARQCLLYYFDKSLQAIWMSSVHWLWGTLFFLTNDFSGLLYCNTVMVQLRAYCIVDNILVVKTKASDNNSHKAKVCTDRWVYFCKSALVR